MDTSIQCRAAIDTAIVNEYAERITDGDIFPPIDVYGTPEQCWIGDGWHRLLAAKQLGSLDMLAIVHEGGRTEALRHALGANAHHGHRRTNADKRRAVEIALREFPGKASRWYAELCGVGYDLVQRMMPDQVTDSVTSPPTVTGRDGKQYPAHREPRQTETPRGKEAYEEPQPRELPKLGPPCVGMQFARIAVMKLSEIEENDLEREQAFQAVERWINEHS